MNTNNVSVSRELAERLKDFLLSSVEQGTGEFGQPDGPKTGFDYELMSYGRALAQALAQPSDPLQALLADIRQACAEHPGEWLTFSARIKDGQIHSPCVAQPSEQPAKAEQPGDVGEEAEVDRIVERLTPIAGTAVVTNEMKARFIGEFSWQENSPYYAEDGEVVEHTATRVVPWDLCKRIYKEMATFAAPPANDEAVRRLADFGARVFAMLEATPQYDDIDFGSVLDAARDAKVLTNQTFPYNDAGPSCGRERCDCEADDDGPDDDGEVTCCTVDPVVAAFLASRQEEKGA